MNFVSTANYGEVLRSVTTQCCVNFMIVYTLDDVGLLDSLVEERANRWSFKIILKGKLLENQATVDI